MRAQFGAPRRASRAAQRSGPAGSRGGIDGAEQAIAATANSGPSHRRRIVCPTLGFLQIGRAPVDWKCSRVLFNGRTPIFQIGRAGSTPAARSTFVTTCSRGFALTHVNRRVVAVAASAVLGLFGAYLILSDVYPHEGPSVALTRNHGIHVGDLIIIAFWAIVTLLLWRWSRGGRHGEASPR